MAAGLAASALRMRAKGGDTFKEQYIKNRSDEEIVIVGSSRAAHHAIPSILSDSLGAKMYNAGMDGQGVIYNYGVLLQLLERKHVKTIVYELTSSFDYLEGDNSRYLAHLRGAYDVKGVDSIFMEVNPTERVKMLSHLYRINSGIGNLLYDCFVAPIDSRAGYVPLWTRYSGDMRVEAENPEERGNYTYDTVKMRYLDRFIAKCRERGVRLIFTVSPYLGQNYSYRYGLELARRDSVPVINFKTDPELFDDRALFQNEDHLNNAGAIVYSRWLGGQLRELLAHPEDTVSSASLR